jgi:hypothetical protein
MPDNVNITVNETTENVVINPSISTDVIDVNISSTTENIGIAVTPELTTININSVTGGTSLVTTVNGQIGDVVIPVSDNNFTNALKTKLDGIQAGAEVNVNADWNSTSGDSQILNKPIIPSISGLATITYVDSQDALKVDKIAGKGLSTNDFTDVLKTKLDSVQSGAEVNVNADWNATSGDAQILNKPTIPSISGLATTSYVDSQDALKVDKVTGKSLILDTEITRLAGVTNFDNSGNVTALAGKVDKVAGSRLITSSEATILSNTSGVNTGDQDLSNLVVKNATITGATKTKITYDSKGLVTAGADATTADISDSTNKRYVTDANLTTIGNQSGVNTGDETTATIKSKLAITTLSGSNTGDQDLSGLVPKTTTVNSKALSSNITLDTSDIADSTNKRYVTDANLTTISNQSGTNTGDNAINSLYNGLATSKQDTLTLTTTGTSGAATLIGATLNIPQYSGGGGSGTVTNVSALTLGTTGTDLSSSVVNSTTTPVITLNVPTASASNRGALSSTDWNTFNAKQEALVSGTNIKTINGSSVLGSGNLTISGAGVQGVHALVNIPSGAATSSQIQASSSGSSTTFTSNRLLAYPFIPDQSFTTSNLFVNVQTLAVSSLCRIAIYDDLNGYPNNRLFLSADLDCSTTGNKIATTSFSFVAGTTYWLAFHGNSQALNASMINFGVTQLLPIRSLSATIAANHIFVTSTFTIGTPTTFPTASPTYSSGNIPAIIITKA